MLVEVPIVEQTVSHNGDFRVQVGLFNSLHGWNQELSPNFPGFFWHVICDVDLGVLKLRLGLINVLSVFSTSDK